MLIDVLKELGVSGFSGSFLMESCEIYWEDMVRAIHYVGLVRKQAISNLNWIMGLEQIRRAWEDYIQYSLQDLIRECRHRQASDPRDKIYSLLGLMHDERDEFLKPDYKAPVGKVW